MKTLVEIMAQSVGARLQQNKNCNVEYLMSSEALEAFAELARADERTWVGLTDEELSEVYNQADWDTVNGWEYERAIEAKLKEKNT